MTDDAPRPNSELPQARLEKRGFSFIWLVPIVALGIVAWLGFQHINNKGPTITITFARGEGLEAGKTQIKHKSVPIGLVKNVELSKDMKTVIVTADMDNVASDYLGKDAKFWVVRPRITAGNISGLDTLVSGSYIVMRPSKGDEVDEFKALDTPPVDVQDVPGARYTLHTDRLASLDEGTTIYYRGIDAGTVLGYRMSEDGKNIDVYMFIRDPYSKLVTTTTRFWNASGFDVDVGANGVDVKNFSLKNLLTGGINFDTSTEEPGQPAKPDTGYKLYDSQRDSDTDPVGPHFNYALHFAGQVHGIGIHAPVELAGIVIGHVTAISQSVDAQTGAIDTPIVIEIDQDALKLAHTDPKHGLAGQAAINNALDQMIRKGYRAQLVSGSLITGQRFVRIDMADGVPPAKLMFCGQYPEIPTTDSGSLDDVTKSATVLLKHLDQTVSKADSLLLNLNQLTGPSQLQDTVKTTDSTLKDLAKVMDNLDNDVRPLGSQLPQLLKELKGTSRSATSLLDYVDRHPESLLLGRSNETSDKASTSGTDSTK